MKVSWGISPTPLRVPTLYIGFVTRRSGIRVAAHDHCTRSWQEYTLDDRLQADEHASPSLAVRPDGRLLVFYSAHCGLEILYRLSTRPEDIAAWSEERRVDRDCVYRRS